MVNGVPVQQPMQCITPARGEQQACGTRGTIDLAKKNTFYAVDEHVLEIVVTEIASI